jgi:predicted enzyme related to lactoylglutathione lyase
VTVFREAFPIVYVDDVERAIEFYGSAFGFERTFPWDRA